MDRINLKGKVAIVTGSASGIGAATARKLASRGAILSLIDINGDHLKSVADECVKLSVEFSNPKPFVFIGDLNDDAVRRTFVDDTLTNFGQIDILINNAGVSPDCSIFDSSMDVADRIVGILFRVPYDMCRLTATHLSKTQGSIINVASVCARMTASTNPAYNSAKAALVQLTKTLADELGPFSVRVNAISPGPIKTNLKAKFKKTEVEEETEQEVTGREQCLLRRCGQPEEVANVIAFMLSAENSYMTGSDVLVDGGMFAKSRSPK